MTRPTSKSKPSPAKAEVDTKPKSKTSAKAAPAPAPKPPKGADSKSPQAASKPKAAAKPEAKASPKAATKPVAKPAVKTSALASSKVDTKTKAAAKAAPKAEPKAGPTSAAKPEVKAAFQEETKATKVSAKAPVVEETETAKPAALPKISKAALKPSKMSTSDILEGSLFAEPLPPSDEPSAANEPFKHVTFEGLIDDASLLAAVHSIGWKLPTPVQAQALPLTLAGRDVCAFAQTGTGKTAVIAITAGAKLLASEDSRGKPKSPAVLVVVPTRELAEQVEKDIRGLLSGLDVKSMSCFGGTDVEKDKQRLAGPIDVVVATPGRLLDHHKHKSIQFDNVSFFVCDEADRMFDMGFIEDIEFIMKNLPAERVQKLMTSATGSEKVRELAFEYLEAPEYIESNPEKITPENIKLVNYAVPAVEKFQVLLGHIKTHKPTCAIVFTNTKVVAEWVGYKLACNGIRAEVLTGDIPQAKRMRLVQQVKNGEIDVLVATDVLSRGLHVSALSHVYNFDVPDEPESFVHRVGRTARAGADGSAISIVCEDYGFNMGAVEKLLGFTIAVEKPEDAFYALVDVSDYPFDDQGRVKSVSQVGQSESSTEAEGVEHDTASTVAGRPAERSFRAERGDRPQRTDRPERTERPERGAEAPAAKRVPTETPRVERGNEMRPERSPVERRPQHDRPAARADVRPDVRVPQGQTNSEPTRPLAAGTIRTPIEGLRFPNRTPVSAGAGLEGEVETSASRRPEPRDVREPRENREFREPRETREFREPRETREFREPRENRDGRETKDVREGKEARPLPRREDVGQGRTDASALRPDLRTEPRSEPRAESRSEPRSDLRSEVRPDVREGRVEGRPESMRRPEPRDLNRESATPRDVRAADTTQPRRNAMPLGVGAPRAAAPTPGSDRRPERDTPRRDDRARETVEEALAAARLAAERRRAVQSVGEFSAAESILLNAGERIGEAVGFVQSKVTETIERNAPIIGTFLERFRAGLRKAKHD